MKFTEEQKEAINTVSGNVVTIASAGSGKTSAYTTRIANLIHTHNVPQNEILAITFTKRASEEIQKRLVKMLGRERSKGVVVGTFHSVAYRLLKALDPEFGKLGIAPDWWRLSTLNDLCKPSTDKNHRGLNLGIKAGELAQFISFQKANNIRPDQKFVKSLQIEFADMVPENLLREAYQTYEDLKSNSRQIDFDDMLLRFYEKLSYDEKFRTRLQKQFKYVLIDEFQDTSSIVKKSVRLINDKNLFVVGDFRQSIYGFINAEVNNILDFKDEFENVKLVELNKNFRSTQNIVGLSNDIISHSPIKKYGEYKPSVSVAETGDKVQISLYQDEYTQAKSIANRIQELSEDGTPLSEMAILVRTNSQTAVYEDILTDLDIPFDVSKSMSFFDRKEVLDLISYIRLVANPDDDASFRRVINSPNRYLSKKFVEDLERFAGAADFNLMTAIKETSQAGDWKFKRGIDNFTRVMQELNKNPNMNAGRMIRNVIRLTRYEDHINENTLSASSIPEKLEAVDKLCDMASKFPNITAFLAHVSKINEKKKKSKGKDAVSIVTVHSSKGLEWDVVFVPNVNEDLFAHKMNPDIEEERRLFYVACSRPRKKLFISWYFYDNEMAKMKESSFIKELLGENTTLEMKKRMFRGEPEVHEFYQSN